MLDGNSKIKTALLCPNYMLFNFLEKHLTSELRWLRKIHNDEPVKSNENSYIYTIQKVIKYDGYIYEILYKDNKWDCFGINSDTGLNLLLIPIIGKIFNSEESICYI